MWPQEVFLSHASADAVFATSVADVLRKHGLPVWYSRTDIRGGQQWHDEIGSALERCDWFLVILSPAAVSSMWVAREVQFALNEGRYLQRIASIQHQDCEIKKLSWVLPQLQTIDFRSDHESGFRELLKVWGIGYRGRS